MLTRGPPANFYLHVCHFSLQADSGLLGQRQLLVVPLPELLQGVDLGLRGLELALQRVALQLDLLELVLKTSHLLPQVLNCNGRVMLRGSLWKHRAALALHTFIHTDGIDKSDMDRVLPC